MTLTDVFAAALKHHREERGISQDRLSLDADLDRTYISQLERGLKSPTLTSIEKIAVCLGINPERLLRLPRSASTPRVPADYIVASHKTCLVDRPHGTSQIDTAVFLDAINAAHDLIDDLYAVELDIASVLGMRNLSSFIGELFSAAIVKTSGDLFRPNPHQDGYPDLLLMDAKGRKLWESVKQYIHDKKPFSPFLEGGVEVKATCGSVPTPEACRRRGKERPSIGDTRIHFLTGYDWKSHHRDTNNLVGLLWDFIERRPRITAMFYSSDLLIDDWGAIVQPRDGGGRTTSVSIMSRGGISKMYAGWLCVLNRPGYVEFINRRNKATDIPEG